MADNNLRVQEKDTFVRRAVESVCPTYLKDLLETEIQNKWNEFVLKKRCSPNTDPDLLFQVNLSFRKEGCPLSATILKCYFCAEKFVSDDSVYLSKDMAKNPELKNLYAAVDAYTSFVEKQKKFEMLLQSELLNINTRKKLQERFPTLYHFFDESSAAGENMPVVINTDNLMSDDVIAI